MHPQTHQPPFKIGGIVYHKPVGQVGLSQNFCQPHFLDLRRLVQTLQAATLCALWSQLCRQTFITRRLSGFHTSMDPSPLNVADHRQSGYPGILATYSNLLLSTRGPIGFLCLLSATVQSSISTLSRHRHYNRVYKWMRCFSIQI